MSTESAPYGFCWYTKHGEYRFTHKLPHPESSEQPIGEVTPVYKHPALSFERIREVSDARAALWHHAGTQPWNLADWGNALAGEVGELCNVIKKIRRIECGMQQNISNARPTELIQSAADEIADVFIYLDRLASVMHIDLAETIRRKFNAISEREGFPQRL